MKLKLRASLLVCALFSLFALAQGCNQADNPTPTAAPPPPPPKESELQLPKVKGKAFDPASNDRYKKMQENFAKQAGS
jgi:hypothetical protein